MTYILCYSLPAGVPRAFARALTADEQRRCYSRRIQLFAYRLRVFNLHFSGSYSHIECGLRIADVWVVFKEHSWRYSSIWAAIWRFLCAMGFHSWHLSCVPLSSECHVMFGRQERKSLVVIYASFVLSLNIWSNEWKSSYQIDAWTETSRVTYCKGANIQLLAAFYFRQFSCLLSQLALVDTSRVCTAVSWSLIIVTTVAWCIYSSDPANIATYVCCRI